MKLAKLQYNLPELLNEDAAAAADVYQPTKIAVSPSYSLRWVIYIGAHLCAVHGIFIYKVLARSHVGGRPGWRVYTIMKCVERAVIFMYAQQPRLGGSRPALYWWPICAVADCGRVFCGFNTGPRACA